jgi:hypothetical protein
MPLIRVLSWNIYHFSTSRAGGALAAPATAHRCNIILDEVHPNGAARNYDLFIIIETQTDKPAGYVNVGALANSGPTGGMMATQQLLAQLQARQLAFAPLGGAGDWAVVPPVYLTALTYTEAISVFFHTGVLTLTGPLTDLAIVAPSPWHTPATQNVAGGTFKGQARFYDGAVLPTEILFDVNNQRRPYRVTFTAGGTAFSIVSHHSPKPSAAGGNATAQQGTSNLANIREITTLRANPVIITGDFNCCTMNPCPNAGCYGNDLTAQDTLTGPGGASYAFTSDALIVMAKAIAATTAAEAAFTHHANAALAAANAAVARAEAVNARNEAITAGTRANEAIAAHTRVVGALHATVVNGTPPAVAAAGAAAVSALGQLPATYIAEALAYRALAINARDAVVTMSNHYNAATTTFLQNYANAIAHAVSAIDNPGASGGHAVNTGNAANAAVGAINGIPVPSAAVAVAAVTGFGNAIPLALAGGAVNGAPGVALARNARDAVLRVANQIYASHIFRELSSLKAAAARPTGIDGYRNHAFDHILTIGAVEVTGARVVDLIPPVMNQYHVAFLVGMNLGTFQAGYKYYSIWGQKGVSDHLPVRADVTI